MLYPIVVNLRIKTIAPMAMQSRRGVDEVKFATQLTDILVQRAINPYPHALHWTAYRIMSKYCF